MERAILHCDLNNFYASVECAKDPSLYHVPLAIAGNQKLRHGIILAKNQIAKELGIKTGQAIWEAKQICEDLVLLPPDFKEYQRCSKMVKEIFTDYTDLIEDFGIDEAWLDVTDSKLLFGDGITIAKTIQKRIYSEIGLSSSIGVSFNKIFAKLGSDYKKPMGITVITKENYREVVWPLSASQLLYVGRSTTDKLKELGIHTIGDLAQFNYGKLSHALGKWGEYLWHFANGEDHSEVAKQTYIFPVKSIGNGITAPRDIYDIEDFRLIAYVLCESIIARMRESHLAARCVSIQLRNTNLVSISRQITFSVPIYTVKRLVETAVALCQENYHFKLPLRTVSISVSRLISRNSYHQLSLFEDIDDVEDEAVDVVLEQIRQRFGSFSIRRCSMKRDMELTGFDPFSDHTIHPVNFFR